MYEIVLGRKPSDIKKYGTSGAVLIGRHYVTMERNKVLANPVYLDFNQPHAILVAGKRGTGKSYTLGVMLEGISELDVSLKNNITSIFFDTMGIYWTMKYPNFKDSELLTKSDIKPKSCDITLYAPKGSYDSLLKKGIPVDKSFSIRPNEINFENWCELFDIELTSKSGLLLERSIEGLGTDYSIKDILKSIDKDRDSGKDEKLILENKIKFIDKWGIFDEKGTDFSEFLIGGKNIIIDLSEYNQIENGEKIKSLVIGFLCNYIMKVRMAARKEEELAILKDNNLFSENHSNVPLMNIFIDEAHEFLPEKGSTLAAYPLMQILREGRQPGISLILATQQPGKINTDVITQSDILLSHRLTSKFDLDAMNQMMQSYTTSELNQYIDSLPRKNGAAIVLDDTNEKIYPIQVRPRFSWHGGENPKLIRGKLLSKMSESVKNELAEENKTL